MIEHVVLVEVPESVESRSDEIVAAFRSFRERIPGVVSVSAGLDFSGRCRPYSIAAVLCMADQATLDGYGSHPAHLELIALLDELRCKRLVADFLS